MRRILLSRPTVFAGCLAFLFLAAGPAVMLPDCRCAQAAPAGEEQEKSSQEGPQIPLVVVNVASVERLFGEIEYAFKVAGRPELTETVTGFIEKNLSDLKGMDRSQPFGVMLFLKSGLMPQPTPVGFVPVTNMADFAETISRGPVKAEKVSGTDDRWELVGPRRTTQVRLLDGYAFIGTDEEIMEGELPDPIALTRITSSQYDISASANLKSMPEAMKSIFLDFLRASAETELQRRDEEPEGRYRLRRAHGLRGLELIEQVLTQGERVTIGWKASEKSKKAVFEALIDAAPDSKLAKLLFDIGGKQSSFSNLLTRNVPLTVSLSWVLDPRGREVFTETLQVAEEELSKQIYGTEPGSEAANENNAVHRFFKPLTTTAKNGHADFFAQFIGQPPGKFVLIGGMKVIDAESLGVAAAEILERLKGSPNLAALTMNVDAHQGIAFHRIEGKKIAKRDVRLYGEQPGLFFGAGRNAIWFAVGRDDAMPELKKAMDEVAAAPETPAEKRGLNAPLRITANLASWVNMQGPEDDRPRPGREMARQAFTEGADRLQIDIRPTESGARLRVEVDEGLMRLIGLGLARRFDRRQQRPAAETKPNPRPRRPRR